MSDKDKETKIELASENEWHSLLGEDNKKDTDLTGFKTVDELATAYKNLNIKHSSGAKLEPLNEESSVEDIQKGSESFFGIKEDSYSEDFKHKKEAFKFKLPSKLIEPFLDEIKASEVKTEEKKKKDLLSAYSKEIKDKVPEEVFENRLNAGLKTLGFTKEEFKELLPDEHRNNPKLVVALTELGKKQFDKKINAIDEGKTELPSDIGVLASHIATLSKERMMAKLGNRDHFHIDEKLAQYKMRYSKIKAKSRADDVNMLV